MPALPIADKATLDAIKALIGTTSPASGDLSTLFRGLKLLADYVDELETRLTSTRAGKLDLVGTIEDAAGTGSIFARLAQIASYTDTLETNLGQTGNAASPTGTVLARLAELLTNRLTSSRVSKLDSIIDLSKYKPFQKTGSIALPGSDTTYDVLSIMGEGYLSYCYIVSGYNTSITPKIQLKVDGTIIINNSSEFSAGFIHPSLLTGGFADNNIRVLNLNNNLMWKISSSTVEANAEDSFYDPRIVGSTPEVKAAATALVVLPEPIYFKNSILVQVTHYTNGSGSVQYNIGGGLY